MNGTSRAVDIGRDMATRTLAWLKDDEMKVECPDELCGIGLPMSEGLFELLCYLCDAILAGEAEAEVEVKAALDYMVNNGSYTMTREGRIALRDAYLAEWRKP